MIIGKMLRAKNREEWRAWLQKNHAKEKEIWLVHPRASTGKKRIPYVETVEEALCFGWIDSTAKKVDDEEYAQRFTPRRNTSNWSEPNIERMRKLIRQKKMTPAGLAVLDDKEKLNENKAFTVSEDIIAALKKEENAWEHFEKFPLHYKRIRIAYIEDVRNYSKEMFQKRLNNFVKKTSQNKRFGFERGEE